MASSLLQNMPERTLQKSASKLEEQLSTASTWANSGSKFWGVDKTYTSLPAGIYVPAFSNEVGPYFEKINLITDDLVLLPDSTSLNVIDQIEKFWTLEEQFKARGFTHKRGILMWGDPGSGKTSTINLISQNLIESGGIVLFSNRPENLSQCLHLARKIEPDRKIIVVLEDLDDLIHNFGEAEYLNIMDGQLQINGVVFIATTNYPENIDKRFTDRPSRFDLVIKIDMPDRDSRRLFLQNKEPSLEGSELDRWVDLSEGFSVSYLKEMIISNRLYGIPIEKVVERLKSMSERTSHSKDARTKFKRPMGFGLAAATSPFKVDYNKTYTGQDDDDADSEDFDEG